jgi:hypothetical protein
VIETAGVSSTEVYDLDWLRVAEAGGAQFIVIFQVAVR